MKVTIHQPQYMPWIGYFHKVASADLFVFLNDVQFKKNEWIHRNRIRNAQTWQWLSVPTSYSFPQLINEVKIVKNSWQKKHLKSLKICYGKAPYFETYIDYFEQFYQNDWETIDALAQDSVRILMEIIGIKTKIELSSSYQFPDSSSQRLVNICEYFHGDTYLAGIGGRGYLDESLFDQSGIVIEYQDFSCPTYNQHWSKSKDSFVPNLSALDLIFNCGPQAYNCLMGRQEV